MNIKKILPKYLMDYLRIQFYTKFGIHNQREEISYIKSKFHFILGYHLNIESPSTYNEKIQWLKLFDRQERYTSLVDKYLVRDHIKKVLGEEYLIPLHGVFNSFDEIVLDDLPNSFVMKTNHGSGGVVVCKDKRLFDYELAKKTINSSLETDYYEYSREWPYKNVKRKIIVENYIGGETVPEDYKIMCINGKVDNIMVCTGRGAGNLRFYFFTPDWKFLKYQYVDKDLPNDFTLPKPHNLKKMLQIAELLSKDIQFCRIDLYDANGKVYFGEITLYPDSGLDQDITYETDVLFGSKMKGICG